jgi:ABC-2 type transport system permease protein
MRPNLWKIWVVTSTEFGSSIRTKSFLIGILLLPAMIGLSILLQVFVVQKADTRTRTVAVVDRTGELYPAIERAAEASNAQTVDEKGKAVKPRIRPSLITASSLGQDDAVVALELSDKVRRGEFDGFVVIPREALATPSSSTAKSPVLEYHSEHPNDDVARNWLAETANAEIRSHRFRSVGIDQALAARLNQPLKIENMGLLDRQVTTNGGPAEIKAAEKVDPVRTSVVPVVLMYAMFFLIMTTTPQLLNSVIEEKMSKISEVLLGSITPFELMMGKLLGSTAIAAVLASLFLASGYIVAFYYGYIDVVSTSLLIALLVFLVLAMLLYGSLYMAVGSACNELKDAQSLMMPIILLSTFPAMIWPVIQRDPSSPLSVGLSLFPPASPYLMLMRLGMQPAPPAWQVGLSIVGTALTALACIWAAGKVLRIGLLMQGKTPNYRELVRWVMAKA